jgi:hypothetical protein
MTPADEALLRGSAMRRQCLVTMLLLSLSLPLGGNIVRLVEAAAPCRTKDNALVAPSLTGLKEALSIMRSGDVKAWDQLLKQKRAIRLPAGMPVFIEDTFESFYRIRPQGMIDSVWTHGFYITCPK